MNRMDASGPVDFRWRESVTVLGRLLLWLGQQSLLARTAGCLRLGGIQIQFVGHWLADRLAGGAEGVDDLSVSS